MESKANSLSLLNHTTEIHIWTDEIHPFSSSDTSEMNRNSEYTK